MIVGVCRRAGTKYTDTTFPVTTKPTKCLYKCRIFPNTDALVAPMMWKRTSEISEHPQRFVDGVQAGDIKQGALEQHVKSVIIDDYIGLNSDGTITFASCTDQDEFWVPLLEKAYAKLHGSFESINGGLVYQVVMDMTGTITACTACNVGHRCYRGAGFMHACDQLGSPESCFAHISSLLRMSAQDFMAYFSHIDACRTFSSDWVVTTTLGIFPSTDENARFLRLESKAKQDVGKSVIVLSQRDRRTERKLSLLKIEEAPLSLSIYRCLEGDYNPSTRSFEELHKEQCSMGPPRELVVEVDLDSRYVYTIKVNPPGVPDTFSFGKAFTFFLRVFATMDIRLELLITLPVATVPQK
ncbi:hypothetical protein JKP88DRAFT_253906 [Tribonema minus]|uniref:Calpain catalytic domain-containing protein n=1 Tax=Tribonema minus TaxID=303371 RepID=A0A836CJL8_9STRA|nr:hypothetical protein JKP88DRAFT_253906 [Tribonema minus]